MMFMDSVVNNAFFYQGVFYPQTEGLMLFGQRNLAPLDLEINVQEGSHLWHCQASRRDQSQDDVHLKPTLDNAHFQSWAHKDHDGAHTPSAPERVLTLRPVREKRLCPLFSKAELAARFERYVCKPAPCFSKPNIKGILYAV